MRTFQKIFFLIFPVVTYAAPIIEIERTPVKYIPLICSAKDKAKTIVDYSIGGCMYWRAPNIARIVIPAEYWDECIYRHELAHVEHGDWHKGRKSSECHP